YNLEAFDPAEYGAFMMDRLAALMGEEGEYVTFVGSLTTRLQMEVVDGAIARQEAAYPRMKQVRERVTSDSSQAQAYRLTKELLVTYPNLVGILNTAAPEAAGIGLAIEEMGLEDETVVVGTSLPSVAGQYLETGAVDIITFWDPRAQAYAMNKLALMVLEGEPIYDGMDLGIPYPGYDNLRLVGKVLYGRGWIEAPIGTGVSVPGCPSLALRASSGRALGRGGYARDHHSIEGSPQVVCGRPRPTGGEPEARAGRSALSCGGKRLGRFDAHQVHRRGARAAPGRSGDQRQSLAAPVTPRRHSQGRAR